MPATILTLGLTPGLILGQGMNPLDHVVNHPFWTVNGWWLWSAQTGNLVITLVIMGWLFPRFAMKSSTGPDPSAYAPLVRRIRK